jgi:FkbM family methyltransferase
LHLSLTALPVLSRIKSLIRTVAFPFYSLFHPRIGFTVFYPAGGSWRAYTRGRSFPVRAVSLEMLEYYRQAVPKRGDLVFDVGGELGYETGQFAELVGPEGHVFTFECLPQHIRRLREIAARWGNVTVIERACWNRAETLEFSLGHTPGSGTAVADARGQTGQALADSGAAKLSVAAETLDALWRQHAGGRPVAFLKMDIEGAEYEALEGAAEMLRHTRRAVIAAYHQRNGVRTADRVAEMLRAAGFRVRIDENHHVYASR